MYAMDKQKHVLLWTIIYLVMSFCAFAFGHMMDSSLIAVGAYSIASVLMYVIFMAANLYFSTSHSQNTRNDDSKIAQKKFKRSIIQICAAFLAKLSRLG
jgi:heme O synthase-like polyprenyltransferase